MQRPDHPLPVLMEDEMIHTDDHPFCSIDSTCGCHEASALMATSTAFGGLYWETHALQHSTWAAQERERARWHQTVFWLSRAIQDLDCALDQWQQVLSWLNLAGNDHRQQDPESLETIRTLMAQVQWHQGRRRALHQQVLREYIEARQHKQQQWEQQDSQHRTDLLSEEQEEV